MATRLPTPGGDSGNWGEILNNYLLQTHNPDGTLKNGSVTGAKLADGTITENKLSTAVRDQLNATGTGGATNLSTTTTATTVTVASDTGSDATLAAATTTAAGVLSAADKAKLNSIDTKANTADLADVATSGSYGDLTGRPTIPAQFNPVAGANVTLSGTYPNITISSAGEGESISTDLSATATSSAVTVASSTGADATIPAATTTAAGVMTAADKTKLNNTNADATVNASDAQLRDRSTHTGTQAISTVSGLQGALDAKAGTTHTHTVANVTGLQAALDSRQQVVRWSGSTWPARPAGAPFGVLFLSTNDANAPAPADANLASGDVWRRHPDAE